MFTSIKHLFVQAMIAIGIITAPQVIPPQEVITPEPQVIVQDQSIQNTQEIKKESPIVNKQKVSNEKKVEEVPIIKTETIAENKEPEIIVEKISGQCGNSNNKNLESMPADKLCAQGNPSSVIEDGSTFKWSCLGSGEGRDIKCSANKKQDGTCGSLANTIMSTNYDKEKLCSIGIASGVSYISNQASWSCSGEYGGETNKCFGFKEITETKATSTTTEPTITTPVVVKTNAVCGTTTYSQYGISKYNLCNKGTYSNLKENDSKNKYTWMCNSTDGGTNVSCSATYQCLNDGGVFIYGATKIPCR
jgi:hypothetical protein